MLVFFCMCQSLGLLFPQICDADNDDILCDQEINDFQVHMYLTVWEIL